MVFKQVSALSLIVNQGSPEEALCRVNIYGVCKNYFQAVNLAIESLEAVSVTDRPLLEALAFKWASKHDKFEVRKKLWLKIAMGFKHSEAKIKELLARRDCPLKITDILTLFEEDQNIGAYKDVE